MPRWYYFLITSYFLSSYFLTSLGETCRGLKVVAHPGSVNARSANALVVFYDIQETTERYLYDTTRVQMGPVLHCAGDLTLGHMHMPYAHVLLAQVLLFAGDLTLGKRTPTRTTLRLGGWSVALETRAADELLPDAS